MIAVPSFWRGDLDPKVQISAPKRRWGREGDRRISGFLQPANDYSTINLYLKVKSYPRIRA